MRFLILAVFVFIQGCAVLQRNPHSQYIKNVEWAVSDIRAVAKNVLPLGVESISSNGREMRSHYYVPGRKEYADGENAPDRFIATFIILGDQRPYEVEVTVIHERKITRDGSANYVRWGFDDQQTKALFEKLRTELTKRREDRNIIDDFRVY